MAYNFRKTHNSAISFVEPTSRYVLQSVGHYTDEKILTFETYKRRNAPRDGTEWVQITQAYEYRPDMLSYALWSVCDYWWLLMEYNGMKDILEFKAGRNIKIPGNPLL